MLTTKTERKTKVDLIKTFIVTLSRLLNIKPSSLFKYYLGLTVPVGVFWLPPM